jgi:amidohydrolase
MIDFLTETNSLFPYTRALRRDFHQYPELGFQEVRTAGIVARELANLGLEVTTGVGRTGVVAMVEGQQPGPVALLRFDMDALPIQEANDTEYISHNPGIMHACGHDGHTSIGLTVARLLQAHVSELAGSVKLVFQPAEEGLGGAEAMIADGVLDHPRPDFSLTLHLWNEKPLGWLGISPGPVMAASEIFAVRLIGKGGHGATPHLTIDPVLAAAHMITSWQGIVSRNVAPMQSAVFSVTTVRGGEAFNVIPQEVEMKGTIRTFLPEVRQLVLDRFQHIAAGVASAMGCEVSVEYKSITPAVVNAPQIARAVQESAHRLFPQAVLDVNYQTMVSEDMAFMMEAIPGCYFFVGTSNEAKGLNLPHHHPRFDIDEDALPRAAALMASATVDLLRAS